MKIEEFDNLAHDEKMAILLKWWSKRLKGKYDLDELITYGFLLDYYLEDTLDILILYHFENIGPEIILNALRYDWLRELYAGIEVFKLCPSYPILKEKFIEDITRELDLPGKSR